MKSTPESHALPQTANNRISMSDQAPVPAHAPTKMPAAPAGEPSKKAAKPAKPRKVEKRRQGRKG